MSGITGYVRRVAEISGLRADDERVEEIRHHLADLVAEHERAGLAAEAAVGQALTAFGPAEAVGNRLREVTPLPVNRTDWTWLAVGVLIPALLWWLQIFTSWHEPFDWFPIVVIVGGMLAASVRQPLLGALTPVPGVLGVRALAELFDWQRAPYPSGWFSVTLRQHILPWPAVKTVDIVAEGLMLAVVCALVGLAATRLRGREGLAMTWQRAAAGLAHLTPLLIAFGLLSGALGALVSVAVWHRNRGRSPFVARHAMQAACMASAAIVSQLLLYRLNLLGMRASLPSPPYLAAVALMGVRFLGAQLILYGSLSALAGHDFRYPLTGWLSRFGRRRSLHA